MSSRIPWLIRCGALAAGFLPPPPHLHAQASEVAPSPAARLEQLDETYVSNLRKYHAPIIQDYLVSLEKLKQSLLNKGNEEDAAKVQSEIERIKKTSTGSGVLSYDPLKRRNRPDPRNRPPGENPPPPPGPPKPGETPPPGASAPRPTPPRAAKNVSLVLSAATAVKSTPDAAGLPQRPEAKAVPIGSAEWTLEKVIPGSYRVSLVYSCAGNPEGCILFARLGGWSLQQVLTSANVTGGINEFRILKLGVLQVDSELTSESFLLQSSDPAQAAVWVKQIILAKAAPGDKDAK